MSVINQNLLLSPEGYQISRSVRLRSSASAYFNRTPASAGNQRTWTWSGWVKLGSLSNGLLFSAGTSTSNVDLLYFNTSTNLFYFNSYFSGAYQFNVNSSAVYRDPSAWYHVVFALDTTQATSTNRAKLYVNGVQQTLSAGSGGFGSQNLQLITNSTVEHDIGRYVTYTSYFDGYMTEVNFIDGQALTPSSFGETDAVTGVWKPKKYTGTYGTNGFYLNFSDNSSRLALGHSATGTHVDIVEADGSNQSIQAGLGACRVSTISTANASYTSAVNEYLVVTPGAALPVASSLKIYFDVNYAWANGRNLYINGTQVSSGNVTVATVSGMQEWTINFAGHGITSLSSITTPVNTGGRAVFYGISIDGSAVVSTANDWTPNNISVTAGVTYDSMLDVPTLWADGGNGRGNYAVWNPLVGSGVAVTDGNLKAANAAASYLGCFGSIVLPSSGKFYFEAQLTANSGGSNIANVGIAPTSTALSGNQVGASNSASFYCGGSISINGSNSVRGSAGLTTDVFQVCYDAATGNVFLGINNTFYQSSGASGGDPANGTNPSRTLTAGELAAWMFGYQIGWTINFGQRTFAYTPPTGFKALNTQNLPDATIKKGNQYFDAITYTGTGSARSVTGLGFQPDLVWVKGRSVAYSHLLTDSVRGVSKRLVSDSTAAEVTDTDTLTAFNSDGFSWGTGIGGNQNAATYVAWQWKESASAGFDIVTYTGTGSATTVAHSLGVAPKMIIAKNRTSGTPGWPVYHASVGNTGALILNATSATDTSSAYWNNTTPTSSVFSVGTGTSVNTSAQNYVAYLFAEVAGFSKFGSYTGNGSADGPFVYLGFRPRYVMVKRTDAINGNWEIFDTARSTYNVNVQRIFANDSSSELTGEAFDMLSNGFKCRLAGTSDSNTSGGTYIYAAFAENPFKNSLAR